MMRWAVEMRTKRPSSAAFKQAFDQGRIVRLHLMRGTWQLVAATDYYALLDLCADKAAAVIRGWMSANHISLPDDEIAAIRSILIQTTRRMRSATKEDYAEALAAHNIHMDDHRLSYHIRMAELAGVLCSGDLLPMKATYALAEDKIGPRVPTDRDQTLARLARAYFRSRQPATLDDFVWWSGLGINDCRRAMTLLGDYLHAVTCDGRTFYLTQDCRTRGFRQGHVVCLPPYDEYLIGYKSRDLVLDPSVRHLAHNNSGIFYPILLHNGIACGNWSPFKPELIADFFPGHAADIDVDTEWRRYRHFLEK